MMDQIDFSAAYATLQCLRPFIFIEAVLPHAGCSRMWKWALAHDLNAARWWRDFFFGRRTLRPDCQEFR